MSALITEEYLGKRVSRGKREAFEAVLKKVPDVQLDEQDRLSNCGKGFRKPRALFQKIINQTPAPHYHEQINEHL
jgi:hypothetical protein